MTREWRAPTFDGRHIELRCENDEVCVYATRVGMERIVAFCKDLLAHPKRGAAHVHLEDYEVLTSVSLKGVIALFDE